MASQAVETHLTPAVRGRLGVPDARLRVCDAAFPVHAAFVGALSGVLSSLLEGCAGGGGASDVVLFQEGSGAPPEVRDEAHFGRFLCVLYVQPPYTATVNQAKALAAAADFFDAAAVLPAADAYLSLAVRQDTGRPLQVHSYTIDAGGTKLNNYIWPAPTVESYLQLASAHRLRRLMATCLPLLSAIEPRHRALVIQGLDATLLGAVAEVTIQHAHDSSPPASKACTPNERGGHTCKRAAERITMLVPEDRSYCCAAWLARRAGVLRGMADEFERVLTASGWGCS
ncbi:MAG: hypothetical protein J3K34DRAFT_521423 [Monoraphidium minutum]|nr:MAG: hypothetical protein J3K34DRAFT_521423 [Monoraphidium minutum]